MIYLNIFKKQFDFLTKDINQKNSSKKYILNGPKFVGHFQFILEFLQKFYNIKDFIKNQNVIIIDELYQENIKNENIYSYTNIDQSHRKNKKTDEISVEDIKQILLKLNISSTYDEKIVIINNFEKINVFATDMLLKVIEENKNTVFFFITTSIQKIKPTIKSRCKIIDFEKKSNEIISTYIENTNKEILDMAIGLPNLAEQIAINKEIYNTLFSLYKNTIDLKNENIINWINILKNLDQKYYFLIIEYLILYLKDKNGFFDLYTKLSKILKYMYDNKIDKKTFLDFIILQVLNVIK